jgi:hypothetical protein
MPAAKDSLKKALNKAIKKWTKEEGTTFFCATRDALTDMMHIAKENGLDFEKVQASAEEVFNEECNK